MNPNNTPHWTQFKDSGVKRAIETADQRLGAGQSESEINRELTRLANAQAELERQLSTLSTRLSAVVCSASPEPERASAVENCSSPLGSLIQARALELQRSGDALCRLIDAIQL